MKKEIKKLADELYLISQEDPENWNSLLEFFITRVKNKGLVHKSRHILLEFQKIYDKQQAVVTVFVESAFQISQSNKDELAKILEDKTGQQVKIKNKINNSLIGGIKVSFEDYLVDLSVVSMINKIKQTIVS